MSEFLDFYKEKKLKKKNSANNKLIESRVAETIDIVLSEKLENNIEYHIFEVKSKILSSVISVIDKSPLVDKYIIVQIDTNLFKAKLKNIKL